MQLQDGQTKVLVIESTEPVRRLMATILEGEFGAVLFAKNAAEGYWMALSERPDVIIADYLLPRSGRACVCERIRENPDLRDTSVIITTSWGSSVSELAYFKTGCDQLVRKPFRCEDIRYAIRKAARMRQMQGTLIPVLFNSGEIDVVDAKTLDGLVMAKKIIGFRRRNTIAVIGQDPVRSGPSERYYGPERRKPLMVAAGPPTDGTNLWPRRDTLCKTPPTGRSG